MSYSQIQKEVDYINILKTIMIITIIVLIIMQIPITIKRKSREILPLLPAVQKKKERKREKVKKNHIIPQKRIKKKKKN